MDLRAVDALRYEAGARTTSRESLAVEAVLQIRVNGTPYTTTVRMPGHDDLLARGLLYSEGVVPATDAVCTFETVVDPETRLPGAIDVLVSPEFIAKPIDDRRSLAATASCGLCGVRDAEDLKLHGGALHVGEHERLSLARVEGMLREMAAHQRVFEATGGCHAAAAFTLAGEMLATYEDIGRHNAVDKVIGDLLQRRRLHEARCLAVSGRLSYEIVFKAFHARIPFLLSVSAPSSMAVEMGEQFGLTVIGFCRGSRATIYSRAHRCV